MSDKTGIQWTDATWNPIRGCSRVSEGCRHCYAEKVAHRFSGEGQPYAGLTNAQGRWNGTIHIVDKHLTDPLRWQRPRRVFVNSMSDLFHENVAADTIDTIFAVMALARRHTFQVLTKRPERMRAYLADEEAFLRVSELAMSYQYAGNFHDEVEFDARDAHENLSGFWPLPNVWLGVSVEDQATADERIPLLLETPAAVRFISAEPLLGPVSLQRRWLGIGADCDECHVRDVVTDEDGCCQSCGTDALWHGLGWVICGGESGPGARPCEVAWLENFATQCHAANVPCFIKQLGSAPRWGGAVSTPVAHARGKCDDINEWPRELRVRQFPEVA